MGTYLVQSIHVERLFEGITKEVIEELEQSYKGMLSIHVKRKN